MDESRLRCVSLADLSGIRHEMLASVAHPGLRPEFLVIRYSGSYRDGGEGRGDALYIVATAAARPEAWSPRCTILDFRDLEYAWGDEMAWVVSIGWNPGFGCRAPLGIVVGEGCRGALQSLLREKYEECCVETMEQAFVLCRRQEREYERLLARLLPFLDPVTRHYASTN